MVRLPFTPKLLVILLILVGITGAYLLRQIAKNTSLKEAAASPKPETNAYLSAEDHIRGDRNAPILFIEYSDLECPFCKKFHPVAKQVADTYQWKVAWVYRHFPLDEIHPKARKEAEATECAAELGGNDAFWRFTDKIYEITLSNNSLNAAVLPTIATDIGLNKSAFQSCLSSGRWAARVESDFQKGLQAGVASTPTSIIINTKTGKSTFVTGSVSFAVLKTIIDQQLALYYGT